MALIKLAQIAQAPQMKQDINKLAALLIESSNSASGGYEGSEKVGFVYKTVKYVAKDADAPEGFTAQEGMYKADSKAADGYAVAEEADYTHKKYVKEEKFTVAQALQGIKDNIKSILGDGSGVSLSSLDERVTDIEDKEFTDFVKVTTSMANSVITAPTEPTGTVKGVTANVYTADGKAVYITDGTDFTQLTYTTATDTVAAAFTAGTDNKFYVLDVTAENTATGVNTAVAYKEITSGDLKLFVKATSKFSDLDSEMLLDNSEMQQALTDDAFVQLTQRVANDETIRKQIAQAIKQEAIDAAVADSTKTLDSRIKANTASIEKAVKEIGTNNLSSDYATLAAANIDEQGAEESAEDYQARLNTEIARLKGMASVGVDEVATSIRATGAVDTLVATEKAVADAIATVNGNASDISDRVDALEVNASEISVDEVIVAERNKLVQGSGEGVDEAETDEEFAARKEAITATSDVVKNAIADIKKHAAVKVADIETSLAYEDEAAVATMSDNKVAGAHATAVALNALDDELDTLNADLVAGADKAMAVKGKDIATTIRATTGEGENPDVAVDNKVASEKAVATAVENLQAQIDDNENDIERIDTRMRAVEEMAIDTVETEEIAIADIVTVDADNKIYTINISKEVKSDSVVKVFVNGIAYSSKNAGVTVGTFVPAADAVEADPENGIEAVDAVVAHTPITFKNGFVFDADDEVTVEFITSSKISDGDSYAEDTKLYAYTTNHKLGEKA